MDIVPEEELVQRREQAIKDDKAYGKSRLKDEFRVKPKPGAEPAYWYKSPYGGEKLPCYRVADCIPIKSKINKPDTDKQVVGRKISGLKAKLRSNKAIACKQAAMWLEADPLFLDTETTGLLEYDQIIELAISDRAGRILFESRFKPTVDVSLGAYDAHGITIEELDKAPTWTQHCDEIARLLSGKPLIIFNADFDTRLLEQTSKAFNLDTAWIQTLTARCAMYLAADVYGAANRYGTISLNYAASMAGVKWKGPAHSAAADTIATVDLVTDIAGYWKDLNEQLQKLLNSRKGFECPNDPSI